MKLQQQHIVKSQQISNNQKINNDLDLNEYQQLAQNEQKQIENIDDSKKQKTPTLSRQPSQRVSETAEPNIDQVLAEEEIPKDNTNAEGAEAPTKL